MYLSAFMASHSGGNLHRVESSSQRWGSREIAHCVGVVTFLRPLKHVVLQVENL